MWGLRRKLRQNFQRLGRKRVLLWSSRCLHNVMSPTGPCPLWFSRAQWRRRSPQLEKGGKRGVRRKMCSPAPRGPEYHRALWTSQRGRAHPLVGPIKGSYTGWGLAVPCCLRQGEGTHLCNWQGCLDVASPASGVVRHNLTDGRATSSVEVESSKNTEASQASLWAKTAHQPYKS